MAGPLANSPAAVIRRLLVNKGMGSDPPVADTAAGKGSWPIYYSYMGDKSPDSAIAVYDSEGHLQGRVMIDGETQERHGLQIIVRGAGHDAAYAKARAIADLLDRNVYQNTVSIGAHRYTVQSVGRTSDVLAMGKEPGTKRSLFSINATATLRQVA